MQPENAQRFFSRHRFLLIAAATLFVLSGITSGIIGHAIFTHLGMPAGTEKVSHWRTLFPLPPTERHQVKPLEFNFSHQYDRWLADHPTTPHLAFSHTMSMHLNGLLERPKVHAMNADGLKHIGMADITLNSGQIILDRAFAESQGLIDHTAITLNGIDLQVLTAELDLSSLPNSPNALVNWHEQIAIARAGIEYLKSTSNLPPNTRMSVSYGNLVHWSLPAEAVQSVQAYYPQFPTIPTIATQGRQDVETQFTARYLLAAALLCFFTTCWLYIYLAQRWQQRNINRWRMQLAFGTRLAHQSQLRYRQVGLAASLLGSLGGLLSYVWLQADSARHAEASHLLLGLLVACALYGGCSRLAKITVKFKGTPTSTRSPWVLVSQAVLGTAIVFLLGQSTHQLSAIYADQSAYGLYKNPLYVLSLYPTSPEESYFNYHGEGMRDLRSHLSQGDHTRFPMADLPTKRHFTLTLEPESPFSGEKIILASAEAGWFKLVNPTLAEGRNPQLSGEIIAPSQPLHERGLTPPVPLQTNHATYNITGSYQTTWGFQQLLDSRAVVYAYTESCGHCKIFSRTPFDDNVVNAWLAPFNGRAEPIYNDTRNMWDERNKSRLHIAYLNVIILAALACLFFANCYAALYNAAKLESRRLHLARAFGYPSMQVLRMLFSRTRTFLLTPLTIYAAIALLDAATAKLLEGNPVINILIAACALSVIYGACLIIAFVLNVQRREISTGLKLS
ncbi:hypothetical protein L1F30_02260 [Simiduia sp. 21SJ11W-1]|uniref:hypothetical protein n=1 Tax=Simiduia sp. 21SJ11W-1 TaxID=2909669 RepID=UPI00209FD60E|nr:hypothetical protein [Simiduia sp. 21SJ11W-1]UTA48379.1 hypothetical protein L1F30_02260 [Simiduia sp. 21SJ11W-1]